MCRLSLILQNIYGVKWSVTNQWWQLTEDMGFLGVIGNRNKYFHITLFHTQWIFACWWDF